LYTDEALRVLNEKFVGFAPGWYINDDDPVYKAAWKRFYLAQSEPDEGDGWLQGTQLVLMTSSGRLLSGSMKYGDRKSLADALKKVLATYAMLPENQRRPVAVEGEVKPQPPPPEGGLVLTIYDRPLGRSPEGSYRLPTGDDFGGLRTEAPGGQRSSLWLSAEECQSLVPENPRAGQTIPVGSKLAKRIWLYGLVPQTLWVVEGTWSHDSVRDGKLQLTVEDVSPQQVRMRIYGDVMLVGMSGHEGFRDLEKRYDSRLEGEIVYDRAAKRITKWNMAALGNYTGEWFAGQVRWQAAKPSAPLPLAFAFELDETAYLLPPERRRPRSFIHAYVFREREQYYWDPEKWEAEAKK